MMDDEGYLYKYYIFDEYTKINLKNKEICFNNLKKFNDPYEGIGTYKLNYDDIIVNENEKSFYDNLTRNVAIRLSEDIFEMIYYKYRVTCFTQSYDNPLMWSHYADSHNGICVKYLKDDIKNVSLELSPIAYNNTIPIIKSENENELHKSIIKLIYSKAKCWDYENEWRAVIDTLNYREERPGNEYFTSLTDENCEYIYAYRPEWKYSQRTKKYILKKCKPQHIYIGLNMNGKDRKELIDICHNMNYSYSFMQRNSSKYHIESIVL